MNVAGAETIRIDDFMPQKIAVSSKHPNLVIINFTLDIANNEQFK